MKKLIMLLAGIVTFNTIFAQIDLKGSWHGTLNGVKDLVVAFNISGENNDLKATLDVPMQNAKDMPCTSAKLSHDTLIVSMTNINAEYIGKVIDVNKIEGLWTQNGLGVPLSLKRMEGRVQLNRPQTPKPPFPYNSEDVLFYNSTKSMEYGATITTPKDDKQHPALILISGSGAQNRDEEIFQHKPFAVVADYLTRRGYVVLRVDDRGTGRTGGSRVNATSADYAKDVLDAITYLKTRKEVDKKKIGLYGHSEGGMIAQMVAADNKDIDFIICMAGPGIKLSQGMVEQNIAVLTSMGLSEAAANSYGELYSALVNDVLVSSKEEQLIEKMKVSIDNWMAQADSQVVLQTTGIHNSASRQVFIDKFVEGVWNKWMTYFLHYDPQPVLEQLRCKVLALNGDRDMQVISKSNLPGYEKALAKSKSKVYETKEIHGVNHLFQECNTCTVQEYAELEQTIKPEVLKIVGDWLDKNVK
ncbi:MAG: alpha/beta hydrolase [Chitinophagaceae bacterium]|nr:alpha/beta hydrolase [Chitinophagaceae bacterium]